MTTAALILAGFCCTAGAAVLDMLTQPRRRSWRPAPYLLLAAGCVAVAIAGFRADLGRTGWLDLGHVLGFGHTMLRADPLAGLFLAVTGAVATPVMLVFIGWVRREEAVPHRGLAAAVALTVAAVLIVVLADNAFVFLLGWEGLSVGFYLLSGYRRETSGQARAAMLTFSFSKASGALLLLGFGLLVGATGSFNLSAWTSAGGTAHDVAYALLLVGFAAKVGVVPLQVWMPTGYAAASGPARALMSAVAANAGFYGMWRILQILGTPPTWLAVVLLLVAAFTALLGIAHAAVQRDLQRVIAYSSVENGGLITSGFAIALAGAAGGERQLIALGLLTASLQMIAHALAKSSLFLASSVIEQRTGRRDLDQLRGVGRDLRLAGVVFSVGALTLAGLPLTVGLVSEWYLLESVMQLFRIHALVLQLSLAAAGALIALALGFAGFTFVRLVGLTILGGTQAPRRRPSSRGGVGFGRLASLGLLLPAVGCIGLAVVSPWELRFLTSGLSDVVPASTSAGALATPWVLQPVYAGFSALSPSWLAVELPILAVATLAFALVASRGSLLRVRRVPAWRSATGGVAGDACYSPFAFATPTRHVLGNLLMTRAGVAQLDRESRAAADATSAFHGPEMPLGEDEQAPLASSAVGGRGSAARSQPSIDGTAALEGAEQTRPTYSADVVELVESFFYRPLLSPLRRLVGLAKRLQSGRLDAYIAYMLITVVALIAVVAGLS